MHILSSLSSWYIFCRNFGKINVEIKFQLDELKLDKIATHDQVQSRLTEIIKNFSNTVTEEHDFQEGAITFFDFLGWKGLWLSNRGNPLKEVADLIESFSNKLKEETSKLMPECELPEELILN